MTLHQTFSALGDPVRFAIVQRLLQSGELSAGEICAASDLSAPAISRHLKVLRTAGVIEQRVARQKRMYSVRQEAMAAIHSWTMDAVSFWQGSLDSLEHLLNEAQND